MITIFRNLKAKLLRKLRSFALRIILLCAPIVGIRILELLFRLGAHIPLSRHLIVSLWGSALLRMGWRIRAANWTRWACERWLSLDLLANHIRVLLEIGYFEEAEEALARADALIVSQPRRSGVIFHLQDFAAILALERGEITQATVQFALERDAAIADYCYKHAWRAHEILDHAGVRHWLRCYFACVDAKPETILNICDSLMIPNGMWDDIIEILTPYIGRLNDDLATLRLMREGNVYQNWPFFRFSQDATEVASNDLGKVSVRLARAYLEVGRFDKVNSLLQIQIINRYRYYIMALLSLYESHSAKSKTKSRSLTDIDLTRFGRHFSSVLKAELIGGIALYYEENKFYDAAHQWYATSFKVDKIRFFLPEHIWRYVSLCMARGDYGFAAHIMREGLKVIRPAFQPVARRSIASRLRKNEALPEENGFFIGCWGIGDDIVRMAMFDALRGGSQEGNFGLSTDPRMEELYERAFPHFKIVPISRMRGPFAVGDKEYLQLREGLSPALDRGRLDINVVKSAKRYRDVYLTEDMLVYFIAAGPGVQRPDRPMLHVLPEKQEAARRWLADLAPGLNVGISWRSGQRDVIRDKSYTDIVADWQEILSLKGVNFINLQYSWDADELHEAEKRHGCRIHTPPFDLKDDVEDIVAMATILDLVLSPGTAVREMCAAAGANVWSITSTPILPDLWRLIEGSYRDRLFPNMTHVTAYEFGDAKGVLAEIGHRLRALCETRAETTDAAKQMEGTFSIMKQDSNA